MDDLGPTAVERSLGALIPGLLVEGSFKEVLRALRRAPSPGFASQWHLWRAQAHLGLGAWAQAEEAARLGIQTCGEDRAKSLALADALQGQGRLAEAEGIYLALLAQSPRDVELLGRYALLCALGAQQERALKLLTLAEATNPYHPRLEALALRIRWLGGEALPPATLYDSLILRPHDPEGLRVRAEWQLRLREAEALRAGWGALMSTLPPGTDVDALIETGCKEESFPDGLAEPEFVDLLIVPVPVLLTAVVFANPGHAYVTYFLATSFVAYFALELILPWMAKRKRRALREIAKAWRSQGPERIPPSLLPPPPRPLMKAGEHGVHRPDPSSMAKLGK